MTHVLAAPLGVTGPVTPVAVEGTGGIVLRGDSRGADLPGAPLVLVHGLASNARMWSGTAAELATLGHPTVALDLRGHGRSDKPDTGYDFPTLVGDLALALGALAAQRGDSVLPILAGQSMGGNLVLEFAVAHPEALAGVVGVDGGTIELNERFPDWADCERELAPPDLTDRTPDELRALIRAGSPDWPEEGIDGLMACFGVSAGGTVRPHLTRARHLRLLRELWDRPPSRLLEQVSVPTLLTPAEIPGSADLELKRDQMARALRALPHGRVHWFAPADHDIHAQQPRALARVLHDAIADGFLA